jgi:hypothetical protein
MPAAAGSCSRQSSSSTSGTCRRTRSARPHRAKCEPAPGDMSHGSILRQTVLCDAYAGPPLQPRPIWMDLLRLQHFLAIHSGRAGLARLFDSRTERTRSTDVGLCAPGARGRFLVKEVGAFLDRQAALFPAPAITTLLRRVWTRTTRVAAPLSVPITTRRAGPVGGSVVSPIRPAPLPEGWVSPMQNRAGLDQEDAPRSPCLRCGVVPRVRRLQHTPQSVRPGERARPNDSPWARIAFDTRVTAPVPHCGGQSSCKPR